VVSLGNRTARTSSDQRKFWTSDEDRRGAD
jgi:hypothetical protein